MKKMLSLLNVSKAVVAAVVSLVIVLACVTPGVVQAVTSSVRPPTSIEGYTDVPFNRITNPALSSQISQKWVRFKAKYSMTVPHLDDLPPEYQDGWVRIHVIDPEDVLTGTLNVIVPDAKRDALSALKYGDAIEVFAYGEPIKTTVFERTVNRILFIVNDIKKLK